jgi:hypothetical protein
MDEHVIGGRAKHGGELAFDVRHLDLTGVVGLANVAGGNREDCASFRITHKKDAVRTEFEGAHGSDLGGPAVKVTRQVRFRELTRDDDCGEREQTSDKDDDAARCHDSLLDDNRRTRASVKCISTCTGTLRVRSPERGTSKRAMV